MLNCRMAFLLVISIPRYTVILSKHPLRSQYCQFGSYYAYAADACSPLLQPCLLHMTVGLKYYFTYYQARPMSCNKSRQRRDDDNLTVKSVAVQQVVVQYFVGVLSIFLMPLAVLSYAYSHNRYRERNGAEVSWSLQPMDRPIRVARSKECTQSYDHFIATVCLVVLHVLYSCVSRLCKWECWYNVLGIQRGNVDNIVIVIVLC